MRVPYFVEIFTDTVQDPEFNAIREVILGDTSNQSGTSLLDRLLQVDNALRVDDYPNFKLWIPVFNKLDAVMFSIVAKYEKELFLPFDHFSVYPTAVSENDKKEAAAGCTCTSAEEGKALLIAILRWQGKFVRQSICEEEYNSLEILFVIIRAFDGDLAYAGLNFLATLCLDPANTRKPLECDKENIFRAMGKRYFHAFCDLASSVESSTVLNMAELKKAAEKAEEVQKETTAVHEIDTVDRIAELGKADTFFGIFRTHHVGARKRADYVCPNRLESLRGLDLLEDTRSLQEIVTSALAHALENNNSIDVQNTVYEDSLGLLWRFRFQREQCHALQIHDAAALWDMQMHIYQIHVVLMNTDDNDSSTVGHFYLDKPHVISYTSEALRAGDVYFSVRPSSSSSSSNVASSNCSGDTREQKEQVRRAFLGCLEWCTVAVMKMASFKFNVNDDSNDDNEDSENKPLPCIELDPPFDRLIPTLGLGKRQMLGLLPMVVKHRMSTLRSIPIGTNFPPSSSGNEESVFKGIERSTIEGYTEERYMQELLHTEQLMDVLFELGDVKVCVPTIVENGIIDILLEVLGAPLSEDFERTDETSASPADLRQKLVRHLPHTPTESLRMCLDSSASLFMDLIVCKKFARDTFKALGGIEIHMRRLEFETEQVRLRHAIRKGEGISGKALGLGTSEQTMLVNLLTIIEGAAVDDQNSYLWQWVSTQRFCDTMKDLLNYGGKYSSPVLQSILRLLEILIQYDPALPSTLRHFHTTGVLPAVYVCVEEMQEPLEEDTLEMLIEVMKGLALTEESLQGAINSSLIGSIFSVFHRKEYLLSEHSLAQSSYVMLGQRLARLLDCNENYEDPIMSAIAHELQIMSSLASEQFEQRMDPKESYDFHHFFFGLCILIICFIQGIPEKALKKTVKMGVFDALVKAMSAANSSPQFFMSCLAKFSQYGADSMNEIDFCYGQMLDILDILLDAKDIQTDILKKIMQNLKTAAFMFGSNFSQRKDLLISVSDQPNSVCHATSKEGWLDVYRMKEEDLSVEEADVDSRAFIASLRHAMAMHFYLSFLHCAMVEEKNRLQKGAVRPRGGHVTCFLERGVADIAVLLGSNGALQKVAQQCQEVWKSRVAGAAVRHTDGNFTTQKKGRVMYRLLVMADKVKVKERPDKSSRTLYYLSRKRGVHACRRMEVMDDEDDSSSNGNMFYELLDGGWVSQVKKKEGDFLQVSLVGLDWDEEYVEDANAAKGCTSKSGGGMYSDLERLQDVTSARQTGVYVFDCVFNTLEVFFTSSIAHYHECLLDHANNEKNSESSKKEGRDEVLRSGKNIITNVVESLRQMCVLAHCSSAYADCGMVAGHAHLGKLENIKIQFDASHVTTIQQIVSVTTGVLFGKTEHSDVQHKGVNIAGLLHLLYTPSSSDVQDSSVLGDVLQGTALVFLSCLPFPSAVCEEGRLQWDLRRSAALGAIDEILHLWFLLLYSFPVYLTGSLGHGNSGGSAYEVERLENVLKTLRRFNRMDSTIKEEIWEKVQKRGWKGKKKKSTGEKADKGRFGIKPTSRVKAKPDQLEQPENRKNDKNEDNREGGLIRPEEIPDVLRTIYDTVRLLTDTVSYLWGHPQLCQLPTKVISKLLTCHSQAVYVLKILGKEYFFEAKINEAGRKGGLYDPHGKHRELNTGDADLDKQAWAHLAAPLAKSVDALILDHPLPNLFSKNSLLEQEDLTLFSADGEKSRPANPWELREDLRDRPLGFSVADWKKCTHGLASVIVEGQEALDAANRRINATPDKEDKGDEERELRRNRDRLERILDVLETAFYNQTHSRAQRSSYVDNELLPPRTPVYRSTIEDKVLRSRWLFKAAESLQQGIHSSACNVAELYYQSHVEATTFHLSTNSTSGRSKPSILPMAVAEEYNNTTPEDALLQLLNCVLAGQANGMPTAQLCCRFSLEHQLYTGVGDGLNSNTFTNGLFGGLPYTDWSSLHQGYRSVVVLLTWLSYRIVDVLQEAAAGGDISKACSPSLEGLLRSFFIVFTTGTNNITLAKGASHIGHEKHLNALVALWKLHPLLQPLQAEINKLMDALCCSKGPLIPEVNASDAESTEEAAYCCAHMATNVLNSMTRTFLWNESMDTVCLALAAIVPGAVSVAREVVSHLSSKSDAADGNSDVPVIREAETPTDSRWTHSMDRALTPKQAVMLAYQKDVLDRRNTLQRKKETKTACVPAVEKDFLQNKEVESQGETKETKEPQEQDIAQIKTIHPDSSTKPSLEKKWTWTDEFSLRLMNAQISGVFADYSGLLAPTSDCVFECLHTGTIADPHISSRFENTGTQANAHEGTILAFRPEVSAASAHALSRLCIDLCGHMKKYQETKTADGGMNKLANRQLRRRQKQREELLYSSLQLLLHSLNNNSTHTRAELATVLLDPAAKAFEILYGSVSCIEYCPEPELEADNAYNPSPSSLCRGGLHSLVSSLFQSANLSIASTSNPPQREVFEAIVVGAKVAQEEKNCLAAPTFFGESQEKRHAEKLKLNIAKATKCVLNRDPILYFSTLLSISCRKALFNPYKDGGFPFWENQKADTRTFEVRYTPDPIVTASAGPAKGFLKVQAGMAVLPKDADADGITNVLKSKTSFVAEGETSADHLQLQQKQRTSTVGSFLAKSLVNAIHSYWSVLAQEAALGGDTTQELSTQFEKAVCVADLQLAHQLLGFADLIHTLGSSSFLVEFLHGAQLGVEGAEEVPGFGLVDSSGESFSKDKKAGKISLVIVVLKVLLLPREEFIARYTKAACVTAEDLSERAEDSTTTAGDWNANADGGNSKAAQTRRKMEFAFSTCRTRQAALYFVGAHLALRQPDMYATYTLHTLFGELDSIGDITNVYVRGRYVLYAEGARFRRDAHSDLICCIRHQ